MRKRRERKAFTLLELLIVIVIIGVLAVVAIPQYMGAVLSAKNNVGRADAAAIAGMCGKVQAAGGACLATGTGTGTVTVTNTSVANPTLDGITYGVRVVNNNFLFTVNTTTRTVTTALSPNCSTCTAPGVISW